MPLNLPYSINGRILDSNSQPLSNANVYLRNERSNNRITLITDSDGQYLGDAANISGGYVVGDTITAFVVYQNQSGSGTHVIQSAGGGGEINITLTSISVSDLRYFTVQNFYDYTGTSSDGDVVSPQKIVNVGINVETEIDNRTNSKFDSNSSSYYSNVDNIPDNIGDDNDGYEYHDCEFQGRMAFFLRYTPIYELTKFEVNTSSDSVDATWTDLATLQLDSCDSTSGWTGASGGTDTITLTTNEDPDNIQEGKAAIYIAKSGTNNATVTLSKTFSLKRDLTFQELRAKVYLDSLSDLGSSGTVVELRYGNDSSNYFSKTFTPSDLGTSWQTLSMELSSVSITGNPDKTALDYFAIVFTLAAASTTLTAGDIRLDDIHLGQRERIETDKETGRVSIADSADYPNKGKNQVRAKYLYGRSSVPNDIKTLAILMTAKQLAQGTMLKSLIGGRKEFNLADGISNIDRTINNLLMRYRKIKIENS